MEFNPIKPLTSLFARARPEPAWRGGDGDVVARIDEDGVILNISRSARETIGAAGDFAGRSLFDFVRREDRKAVRRAMVYAIDGDLLTSPQEMRADFRLLRLRRAPSLAEATFRRATGRTLSVLIREKPRMSASAKNVHDTVKPVAPAPRREDEIAPVVARATPSAEMIADLGHEMKTPLNAIMGFAETMGAETFGPLGHPKYEEYAEHIRSSGAHLLDLISGILDQAKIDAGRYDLTLEDTQPGDIAAACAEMVRAEAEKAGLALRLEIAPDLPVVPLDARLIRQVLINLLSNAVKFTESGEIVLTVREKCGALDFIVKDTGVGMSRVALAKLGGRFTDVHRDGVRGADGAGLGLSLAFSLAKAHGGALVINSEIGEGTTARLTVPLRQDKGSALSSAATTDIQSQFDPRQRFPAVNVRTPLTLRNAALR